MLEGGPAAAHQRYHAFRAARPLAASPPLCWITGGRRAPPKCDDLHSSAVPPPPSVPPPAETRPTFSANPSGNSGEAAESSRAQSLGESWAALDPSVPSDGPDSSAGHEDRAAASAAAVSAAAEAAVRECGEEGLSGAGAAEAYRVLLRRVLGEAGALDRLAGRLRGVVHVGSAWFTSTPLATAASLPAFQLLYLAIAAYFAFRGAANASAQLLPDTFRADTLAFHPLEWRASAAPAGGAPPGAIVGLGLLRDGCLVPGAALSLPEANRADGREGSGQSVTVVGLEAAAEANGYWFQAAASGAWPVRWVVNASGDGGRTWSTVGASAWGPLAGGGLALYPQLPFEGAAGGGVRIAVDMSRRWERRLLLVSGGLELTLTMLVVVVAGRLGRGRWAKGILVAGLGFGVGVVGLAAAELAARGNHREAVATALPLAAQVVLVAGIALFEARIVTVFLAFGLLTVAAAAARQLLIYRGGISMAVDEVVSSPALATIVFAVLVSLLRRRALSRARGLVRGDLVLYDRLWGEVCAAADAHAALAELRSVAQALARKLPTPAPRQRTRPSTEDGGARAQEAVVAAAALVLLGRRQSVEEVLAPTLQGASVQPAPLGRRVRSLELLYLQARCLHPLLLAKVQEWAAATGGLFPLRGSGRLVAYAEAAASDPPLELGFARVKAVARAVEKVVRVYGQDASQLLDLCRQAIVFERPAGVLECLRAVATDRDVALARVKNRLDPAYHAAASGGYRDLALNLRLVSLQAAALGLDGHVCELQLLLRPFAELKSDAGHQRYVMFRNLRGE